MNSGPPPHSHPAAFSHSPAYRLAMWTLQSICTDLQPSDATPVEQKTFSDEQLNSLAYHFGDALLASALELVEKRSVGLVKAEGDVDRPPLYRVTGSTGAVYYCLKEQIYCGCPSHKLGVVRRAEVCLCKHSLALHLSDALGLTTVETVPRARLDEMMQHI